MQNNNRNKEQLLKEIDRLKARIIKLEKSEINQFATVHLPDRQKQPDKQIEEALKESEERYRNIIEGLFVSIAIHVDNKIVFVNKALKNLLGFSSEQNFTGRNILEFVHIEDHEKVMNTIKAASESSNLISNDAPYVIEERLIRNDGVEIIVEASAILINYYGDSALMVMLNDITVRKQAEKELKKHREHLEELVKERTHELDDNIKELKRLNKLFVGREFRIKELREKLKELEKKTLDNELKTHEE